MTVLTAGQVAWAAQQGGFTGSQISLMTAIAGGESSWDTTARGHYVENGITHYVYGLWQISDVHKELLAAGNWADPVQNARMAKSVYDSQGLKAWEAYTNGSYLRYYAQSVAGASNPVAIGGTGQLPTGTSGVQQTGIGDAVSGAAKFAANLTNGYFWLRVGEITVGVVLLIVGLGMMAGNTSLGHSLSQGLKNYGGSGKTDWIQNVAEKKE